MSKKMSNKITDELKKNPINEDYFDISITYIQGYNNSDIICAIIQTYGEDNIHFVNYDALFADYTGEKVVVFNNFNSSVPLGYMAQLIDAFPCVPTRHDRITFCSERIFIVSDILLDEQYTEYLHDTSPHAFWARFLYSFDSVIVCENDSVQSYATVQAYLAETRRLEVRQSFKESLKEAIKEYQPQNYPSRGCRGWSILHMYIQTFDLFIQNTSGCKGNILRHNERYRVVDRAGNIVIDNVTLEYLNGLLDYMAIE